MNLKRVVKECDPIHMNQLLFEATNELESSRNSRMGRRMLEKFTEYELCLATAALGVAAVAREILVAMAGSVAVFTKLTLHVYRVFTKTKACERAFKKLPGKESCIYQIKRIGAQTLGIGCSLIGAALFWYKGVKWDLSTQKRLGNYTPFVPPQIEEDIQIDDNQQDEPGKQPAPDIAAPDAAQGVAQQKVATAPKATQRATQRASLASVKRIQSISPKQQIPNKGLPPTPPPRGKVPPPIPIRKSAAKAPTPPPRNPVKPLAETPPPPPPRNSVQVPPPPPPRANVAPVASPPPPPPPPGILSPRNNPVAPPPAAAAMLSPRSLAEQLADKSQNLRQGTADAEKAKREAEKKKKEEELKKGTARTRVKKQLSASLQGDGSKAADAPPRIIERPKHNLAECGWDLDFEQNIYDFESDHDIEICQENEDTSDMIKFVDYIKKHLGENPKVGEKIPLKSGRELVILPPKNNFPMVLLKLSQADLSA